MVNNFLDPFPQMRNLDFHKLLPLVDVRPEYVIICDMNYIAGFLLRVFERRHLVLYDEFIIDCQKWQSYKESVRQKWTTQQMVTVLGAVYRKNSIPNALKILVQKDFIMHEYAMNGRGYVGQDIFFNTSVVQDAINEKFPIVRPLVDSGMGTEKVFKHPKRGRPFGAKTVNRKPLIK